MFLLSLLMTYSLSSIIICMYVSTYVHAFWTDRTPYCYRTCKTFACLEGCGCFLFLFFCLTVFLFSVNAHFFLLFYNLKKKSAPGHGSLTLTTGQSQRPMCLCGYFLWLLLWYQNTFSLFEGRPTSIMAFNSLSLSHFSIHGKEMLLDIYQYLLHI